jgi:hypothetical protein
LRADEAADVSSIDPPTVKKNDQSMERKKLEEIPLHMLAAYSTLLSFGGTVNRSVVK